MKVKRVFILPKINARVRDMKVASEPINDDTEVGRIDMTFELYLDPEILEDLGAGNLVPALWEGDGFELVETKLQPRFKLSIGFQHHDMVLSVHKTSHKFKDCRIKKFEIKPTAGQAEVRFQAQFLNPPTAVAGWLCAVRWDREIDVEIQPGPQGSLLPEDKAKATEA